MVQNNEQVILHLPINSIGNSDNPTPYEEPRNNFLKIDEFNNEILNGDTQSGDKLFININSITDESRLANNSSNNTNNNTLNDIIEEIREQRHQEISYTNNSNDKYSFIFMDYIETNKSNSWPSKSKIDCLMVLSFI